MKQPVRPLLISLLLAGAGAANATFSIVAVDPITDEVGSAVATCVNINSLGSFVSRFAPGKGAINAQSLVSITNLENGQDRLLDHDSADEVLDWLLSNDENGTPGQRQYAIVSIATYTNDVVTAHFTGDDNTSFAGSLNGPDYAIAGNILLEEEVLLDMQAAFTTSSGWLGDRLMATLQAAKRPRADRRCPNTSALAAYIGVSRRGDQPDAPYLRLDVRSPNSLVEPIDLLQDTFDDFKTANFAVDTDDDGIPDAIDNCTLLANPGQQDTDEDGYGNRCDADFSQSCIHNFLDLGIFRSLFFSQGTQADLNSDGVVNAVDLGLFRSLYFQEPGPSAFGFCP
ncbi:MAG: DUF1028 domain-containing protein [Pseudomonadota bacterium]